MLALFPMLAFWNHVVIACSAVADTLHSHCAAVSSHTFHMHGAPRSKRRGIGVAVAARKRRREVGMQSWWEDGDGGRHQGGKPGREAGLYTW